MLRSNRLPLTESSLCFSSPCYPPLSPLPPPCLQGITCVHGAAVMELMRGVRSHLSDLIAGLSGADLAPMSLGLSHSLARYKLKFSPDKVMASDA